MDKALQLRVMFDMIDNITKPMKTMLAGSKGLAGALKDTRRELGELQKTQKNAASFREMIGAVAKAKNEMKEAHARVGELTRALRASGPPSKQMIADFEKAKQAAAKLTAAHTQQVAKMSELREKLSAAGIETKNLSRHERELRASIDATKNSMAQQQKQLEQLSEREKRVANARKSMNRLQSTGANMAVTGYAARSSGERVLGGMYGTLDEAKKIANERGRISALGLGDEATKDAEKYVRAMHTMGVSTSENMTLMRDSLSIFADEHHAQMAMPTLSKMKFANEAVFGAEQGHENEEKFMNMLKVIELRGGTKNEKTFTNEANMVQKVLSGTGGRVGGDEWRNFIQTGKTAAKLLRQDAFYYQMEPLIQEMGGHAAGTGVAAAYSNLMQGKTTVRAAKRMVELGLVDKKSVEYTTTGTVKRIKPGALIGHELYEASPFEWMQKVLLPRLKAKGITEQSKILNEFATIMTNGNGANFFSTMYMQQAQIEKSERLNRGAAGIDDLHKLAVNSPQGKEIDLHARLANLKLELGEKALPLYVAVLEKLTRVTEKATNFMQAHPVATKNIVIFAAAIGALLAVLGTLTIALAGVLGPFAVLRFSMTMLGMQGGILSRVLGIAGAAIRLVGKTIGFVGRALLLNPIGLTITGIALAAFLIYRYWKPISGFFSGVWGAIKQTVSTVGGWVTNFLMNWTAVGFIVDHWNDLKAITAAIWGLIKGGIVSAAQSVGDFFMNWTLVGVIVRHWDEIKAAAGAAWNWIADTAVSAGRGIADFFMNWTLLGVVVRNWDGIVTFMSGLVGRFTTLGGQIIDGMITGFMGGMTAVRESIHNAGENMIAWFKEKLGIHSPSRVFAELGGYIGQGAAMGIEGEGGRVARAAISLATVAATSFAAPPVSAVPIVRPTVPFDTRAPLSAVPASAQAAAAGPSTYPIHIYAAPGMDPQAIARAVTAELDRRERDQRARRTSSLSDHE